MSVTQAQRFTEQWTVVAQYNHTSDPYPVYDEYSGELLRYDTTTNGLSATVFEEASTHKRYLAIRGTDDLYDVATDLVSVAILGTTQFQGQYQSLKLKVQEWIANGTLPTQFTVTGHSLGGFLATGLTSEFGANVSHAYLYNAPGVGSIAATQIGQKLLSALHIVEPLADTSKFSNIRADAGVSPIAGLGLPVSPVILIAIENQFLSDVTNPPAARNHSQQVLTDALAVYNLFGQIDADLQPADIGAILKVSSNRNAFTLERAVQALGKVFLGAAPAVAQENREDLYQAIFQVRDSVAALQGLGERYTVRRMGLDASANATAAHNDIAYRYALKELNPFAVLGKSYDSYAGTLALYDPATGAGVLTDAWLADRAAMLSWKNKFNTIDGRPIEATQVSAPWRFADLASGTTCELTPNGAAYTRFNQVIFGKDDAADTLSGDIYTDRLYGGGDADILTGGRGNDFLEGGSGEDTYRFASGDGQDVITDTDGIGRIEVDGIPLAGGKEIKAGARVWESGDHQVRYRLYSEADGTQTLNIDYGPDFKGRIFLKNFTDNRFGIHLADGDWAPLPPTQAAVIGGFAGDFLSLAQTPVFDGYWIAAQDDSDVVIGSNAADIIEGGTQSDILMGSNGNDLIYGEDRLQDALQQVAYWVPTGLRGDWASGGLGDDLVVGSPGNDVLFGEESQSPGDGEADAANDCAWRRAA